MAGPPSTGTRVPALEAHGLTVRYGSFTALDNVSARFETGLIHAIVGQNGAGKTTFARAAAGLVAPAGGDISVLGAPLAAGGVLAARMAGVELVHQSFALPPSFTIAEVLQFVGPRRGLYTRRAIEAHWQGWLDRIGIDLSARARIRDLPVEAQQAAEIARAMVSDARVLILDEPTAVLSPEGIERLFSRVRSLRARGVTVFLVLHKIREVLAIADTVTVLRGGRLVAGPMPTEGLAAEALSGLIIGEAATKLDATDRAALTGANTADHQPHAPEPQRPRALILQGVSVAPGPSGHGLADVALEVGEAEIVGIAGVEGNGQRDLIAAIAGLEPLTAGTMTLSGSPLRHEGLAARRKVGLRIIPFERNVEGLSLTSSLWENWAAGEMVGRPLLAPARPGALRRAAEAAFALWDVRFSNADQPAGSLSGGNAQKVILSREVDAAARLILAAQPTRGLDIGATAGVWQALRGARDRGAGVLLISSDLDELFDICDRIVVMASGRAVAAFAPPYDIGAIGQAMVDTGEATGRMP
ncbi:ABC transporter ATP-binding protein [Pseudogemmobacter sonorensis]|uniref:ABC transporter ATP-binding protein n=1 Tax=Pseudogemmobacter sonorensis TaxID=2989681 RepID=UPI0036C8D4A3